MDFPKSVPGVGLVGGRYVDENQATGQPGTLITSQTMNALTDELLAVITAGGFVPSESDSAQLLKALQKLFSSDNNVQMTAPTGVALLPEGTNGGLPGPGAIPAGFFLLRGNKEDPADYRPEFWNRVSAAWETLSSCEWVVGYVNPLFPRVAALEAIPQIVAPGSAPAYACRAWVNFDGTGVPRIRGSGNVSSITDNGVGNYTINLITAMPDVNCAAVANASSGGIARITASAVMTGTNKCLVDCNQVGSSNMDPDVATLVIFR